MHTEPLDPPERPGGSYESAGDTTKDPQTETRAQRIDRIFASLPPLDSSEYLDLLKTATAADLPAEVLVRAYRQLKRGLAAEATLSRLVGTGKKYGYLDSLYSVAQSRLSRDEGRTLDDLVADAIGEIVVKLGGPQGANADKAWRSFCRQRLVDVHREQIGRHGERRPKIVHAKRNEETDEEIDPMDGPDALHAPWHGTVRPNNEEWLRDFARRTFARIRDDNIRTVGLNLVADDQVQISSKDPTNTNTLEHRLRASRDQINRWQKTALAILRAALEQQNEQETDTSWLKRQ